METNSDVVVTSPAASDDVEAPTKKAKEVERQQEGGKPDSKEDIKVRNSNQYMYFLNTHNVHVSS